MNNQTDISEKATRTAILPSEGLRAVQRGPIRIRFVPSSESFNTDQAFEELQRLGFDLEGFSPKTLERLRSAGPEIVRYMIYENLSPEKFAQAPDAFKELLGDELVDFIKKIASQATAMRSVLNPPDLKQSTRRIKRRKSEFTFSVSDPQFDKKKLDFWQKIIDWGSADPANMKALQASPGEVIDRLGANQHPAVRKVLLAIYTQEEVHNA